MRRLVGTFAIHAARAVGSVYAISVAFAVFLLWAISGPFLGFSETWQLIINTVTTITTGLIVFIIQYSQNKDTAAVHLKLDEILISLKETNSEFAELEQAEDDRLEHAREQHKKILEPIENN